MKLLGVSPAVFGLGLLGLAIGVLLLHLLRVRLRPLEVPTLLFYRQVSDVHRPRSLLGRPSRWLALLLALLLVSSLWFAFAQPVSEQDGATVTVIDAGLPIHAATASACRGRVIEAGARSRLLWQPGEPRSFMGLRTKERWRDLASTLPDTIRAASGGDRVLVLGGPKDLPTAFGDTKIVRMAPGKGSNDVTGRLFDVGLLDGDPATLWFETDARKVVLLCDGVLTPTQNGRAKVPAETKEFRLTLDGRDVTYQRTSATGRTDVLRPRGLPIAVRVAMASDPRFRIAADAVNARIQIGGRVLLRPDLPALWIQPGTGNGPREAIATPDCPIRLSLQDQRRENATALIPTANETVWVEDARTGEPLVAAHGSGNEKRIRIVGWLLDEMAHRDVPRLITGSLQMLADLDDDSLGSGLRPRRIPAATRDETRDLAIGFSISSEGAHRVPHSMPAVTTLQPIGDGLVATAGTGPDHWRTATWLLFLALALLLVDVFFYHRGRMP